MKIDSKFHITKQGVHKRNPTRIKLTENQVKLILTGLDFNDKAQSYWNKWVEKDNVVDRDDAFYYKAQAIKILEGFSNEQRDIVRILRAK